MSNHNNIRSHSQIERQWCNARLTVGRLDLPDLSIHADRGSNPRIWPDSKSADQGRIRITPKQQGLHDKVSKQSLLSTAHVEPAPFPFIQHTPSRPLRPWMMPHSSTTHYIELALRQTCHRSNFWSTSKMHTSIGLSVLLANWTTR